MQKFNEAELLSIKTNTDTETYWLSETFHEQTKLNKTNIIQFSNRIKKAFNDESFLKAAPLSFKNYNNVLKIALPNPKDLQNLSLASLSEVIQNRRTCKNFQENTQISKDQLSYLLYYSYGITHQIKDSRENEHFFRSSPSAGGLFPCEIYILINNVEKINKGLYHYNVKEHQLECLYDGELSTYIETLTTQGNILKDCSIVIFITAIFPRTLFKYGNRGYRFIHLDTGHLAQNLMLCSTALGLASFPCGGYFDDRVNHLLGLDGVNETVVYELGVGISS